MEMVRGLSVHFIALFLDLFLAFLRLLVPTSCSSALYKTHLDRSRTGGEEEEAADGEGKERKTNKRLSWQEKVRGQRKKNKRKKQSRIQLFASASVAAVEGGES